MKKFLSLALAVIMVLALVPVAALPSFATATGTVVIKDAQGNTPEAAAAFTDINSAFDWVYAQDNSADYTIHLTSDVTTDTPCYPLSYDNTKVRTINVNGAGHTLTYTGGVAIFYGIGLYNLNLTDLDILAGCLNPLDWSPRLNPNDNYHIYDIGIEGVAGTNKAMVDSYAVFTNVTLKPIEGKTTGTIKLKGGDKDVAGKGVYHVKMVNCEFYCNTGDTMFMQNCGSRLDLDLVGTKLVYTGGAGNNFGNNHMFQMNSRGVDISVENYTDPTTGATVVSRLEATPNSNYAQGGIFCPNNANAEFKFTFAKDVELVVGGANKTDVYFNGQPTVGTQTWVDNGAKWIAKKDALAAGTNVNLPALTADVAWFAGDTAIDLATHVYKNTAATADAYFTHATAGEAELIASSSMYVETSDGKKEYFTNFGAAFNKIGTLYNAVTTADVTDEALWKAAGSPVVYVYKDITIANETYPSWGTSSGYNANRVKTLVIKGAKADGKNVTITSTVAGAAFSYLAYHNFTLENVDLNCTNGFALFWRGYNGSTSGKATTNVVNCNIKATGTGDEGLVFKVTGNKDTNAMTENFIINFVNTKVESVSKAGNGVNAMFLFHHGCAGELNIDGKSEFINVNDRVSDGGDTMFMMGTNRKFVINVKSGAKLTGVAVNAKAGVYSLFKTENSNTYPSADGIKNVINIEDGAVLTINADDAWTKPVIFINQLTAVDKGNTYINVAEGAQFKVNAKAAELGFTTITTTNPYVTDDAEKSLLGWNGTDAEGKSNFYASGEFAAGAVTGAMTFSPAFYSEDDFVMLKGAGYKEGGIAFGFSITDALLSTFGEDAVFGIMIAPTEYTQFGFNKDMLSLGQRIELTTDANGLKDGEGVKTCILGIDGIPTDNANAVNMELSAIGYIEYKTEGGKTAIIYTADTYAISYAELEAAAAK